MNNIKKINTLISTVCLAMLMTFVGAAAILSSHNKISDSDPSYSTVTTTKTTLATTTTLITSTTTTTTTSTTPTTTTTSTTTKTPTTTTTKTTPATTTTTTSTTTIATETAAPESEFVEVTYQELETETTVVETTEAVDEPEPATEADNYYSYASVCDTVTYYGNYGHEVSGASGNTLISGYSCACDLYPFGTILYVETSDGAFSGYLRVDDRVSDEMNTTIVDIYYYSYDMAPYNMQDAGKYTTYYIDDWHPTCIINVVG